MHESQPDVSSCGGGFGSKVGRLYPRPLPCWSNSGDKCILVGTAGTYEGKESSFSI